MLGCLIDEVEELVELGRDDYFSTAVSLTARIG